MNEFKRKQDTIQAVQYEGFGHGGQLVEELPKAVEVQQIQESKPLGASGLPMHGHKLCLRLRVTTVDKADPAGVPGDWFDVMLGKHDWLVWLNNTLVVMSDEEFRERYEPAKNPVPLVDFEKIRDLVEKERKRTKPPIVPPEIPYGPRPFWPRTWPEYPYPLGFPGGPAIWSSTFPGGE